MESYQQMLVCSLHRKNYEVLANAMQGKAVLQTGELKKYLSERKKNKQIPSVSPQKSFSYAKNPDHTSLLLYFDTEFRTDTKKSINLLVNRI